MMPSGLARYQENEILGLSPARRVVWLYSNLLARLRRAAGAAAAGDIESRAASLMAAQDVVGVLMAALDEAAAPELAQRLAAIYRRLWADLLALNREPDPARLDRLIHLITGLHETWDAAARATEASGLPGRPVL